MSNVSLVDGHIDEPKMTDEEIIKALECCMNKELNGDAGNLTCLDCPLCNCSMDCLSIKSKNALDLINRKDAEIERLRKEHRLNLLTQLPIARKIKAEAIKEFAHLLIDKAKKGVIYAMDIPDYVKEMVGD